MHISDKPFNRMTSEQRPAESELESNLAAPRHQSTIRGLVTLVFSFSCRYPQGGPAFRASGLLFMINRSQPLEQNIGHGLNHPNKEHNIT